MADIHQIISLGLGTPADIPHFILVGLSPEAAAVAGQEPSPIVVLAVADDLVVRVPSDDGAPMIDVQEVAVRVPADDLVVLVSPDEQGVES